MRLPKYTEARYRHLRLAVVPLRLAVTTFALATVARLLWLIEQPTESTGSTTGDIAFGATTGLLVGIHIVMAVMLAAFIWTPLPKPEGVR